MLLLRKATGIEESKKEGIENGGEWEPGQQKKAPTKQSKSYYQASIRTNKPSSNEKKSIQVKRREEKYTQSIQNLERKKKDTRNYTKRSLQKRPTP